MQQRTSVNQAPGGGTLYPFSTDCPLVQYVLDFYLSYEDDPCAYVLPFSLTVSGTWVAVSDAQGTLLASGDLSTATETPWGSRAVYELLGASTVMRLVTQGLGDGTGVLDSRTVDRVPGRIRSISVGTQTFCGPIVFEAEYNIQQSGVQTARTDGGRYVDQVNMDAVPGAGMGRQPGCDEETTLLRRINNVGPDAGGNFVLDFDACFRGQLAISASGGVAYYSAAGMTEEEAKSSIVLYSDCHPCYDCSYFVRTYRGLKSVWNKWAAVAAAAEAVRDTFEANSARWNAQAQCRIDNAARLVATSEPNCKAFIGGSYCNASQYCVSPVELRFTLQKYKGGVPQAWPSSDAQVIEAYLSGSSTGGEVAAVPDVTGPVVRFTLDYADPQQTSMARFRVCADCASDESLGVTLTAHVPDPVTTAGQTVPLHDADVPAGVAAAWAAYGVDASDTRAAVTKVVPMNPSQPTFECGDCGTTTGGSGSGGGSGGPSSVVSGETPSGPVDGANATFTLSVAPSPASSLLLFRNGIMETGGYTLSGTTVTYLPGNVPETGDVISAYYAR